MSVRELLATHTSYELAEWRAFDLMYGLGDDEWTKMCLADIRREVAATNHLLGAAHFTEENDPDSNPVPSPESFPLPNKMRHPFHFELQDDDSEE